MRIKALAGQRWSAVEAREILGAQARSGLSIPGFAKEYDLSLERLYRWRRKLGRDDTPSEEVDEIEFAPVVLRGEPRRAAVVVRVDDAELEVVDPTAVDPAWLGELVRCLGAR